MLFKLPFELLLIFIVYLDCHHGEEFGQVNVPRTVLVHLKGQCREIIYVYKYGCCI
jgi:hypothetical protein